MSECFPITVLGAGGWIGSNLVRHLRISGRPVVAVSRAEINDWLSASTRLGTVIYCIGMTADFRSYPHETVEAHVSLLSKVIRKPGITSLLFLSSTRLYSRCEDTFEDSVVPCVSSQLSDLYNISKLLGESLILQDSRIGLKVVRLSNVVGHNQPISTFVGALLEEFRTCGYVTIREPSCSCKDYVCISDVVTLLPQIAECGIHRLYNLGSGINTSHAEIASYLERLGANVSFMNQGSSGITYPTLRIDRLSKEFSPPCSPFAADLVL